MDAPRWEVSWCLPVMDLSLVLPSARADMVSLVGVTATTRVGVKPGGSVGTIVCRWDRRMRVM
jgi:hypothetical protein